MDGKTIKQIADEIGVSKTAIRKKIDEAFRAAYIQSDADGTLYITETGCDVLRSCFRKRQETAAPVSEDTGNRSAETSENLVTVKLVEMLQEQLTAKDRQIEELNARLAETTAALTETQKSLQAAQALHAGTMQTHLLEGDEPGTVEPKKRKSLWGRLFNK